MLPATLEPDNAINPPRAPPPSVRAWAFARFPPRAFTRRIQVALRDLLTRFVAGLGAEREVAFRGLPPAGAGRVALVPGTAILDIDGTLVDTNYQHTVAWARAFRQSGVTVPLWRVHRSIGMGGEKLVPALVGDEQEEQIGETVRAAESVLYSELMSEVAPFPSARRLVEVLKGRGVTVVLASSAKAFEVEHYLDLLDARELADGWTSSADVENTKPEPDLVSVAIEKAGGGPAVMVGDSPFDCEAARRLDVSTVGVLTGGFSSEELEAAGASVVFDSLEGVLEHLEDTPLARLL